MEFIAAESTAEHPNQDGGDVQSNKSDVTSHKAAGSEHAGKQEGSTSSRVATKERRHQIPGLRQTPYLKVLLLRCDDNDKYKSQVRQQARDWIKEHTSSNQSNKGSNSPEYHDAFEWLLVHVVIPNTAAANQPRTSGKSLDSSLGLATDKISTARWRGGGGATLLDRFRTDFNSSARGSIDHVAQIRIGINDVPYDLLPRVVPAIPGSYVETAQDVENAWLDLVRKLKELILSSFDTRVGQYEEDIRERDRQRHLPGWNFCTFFVLKEGLARGFESVGLVEDALAIHDELVVGLDAVLQEQSSNGISSFLPYTEESRSRLQELSSILSGDNLPNPEALDALTEMDTVTLSLTKKPFRELILSSNISVFDFRCYIFTRQTALLLRLANAWSFEAHENESRGSATPSATPTSPKPEPFSGPENAGVLAEICKRTAQFIPTISRIMRSDLLAALQTLEVEAQQHKVLASRGVENMITSFTFSLSQQVLRQTHTKTLAIPLLEPSIFKDDDTLLCYKMKPVDLTSIDRRIGETAGPPRTAKSGLDELSAQRGELYLQSSNTLERMAMINGLDSDWIASCNRDPAANLKELIDRSSDAEKPGMLDLKSSTISTLMLRTSLTNNQTFYRLYEMLTVNALMHYVHSDYLNSAVRCLATLAQLKYTQCEYEDAAAYLRRVTLYYNRAGWSHTQYDMLRLFARCLKQIPNEEEYVRVLLVLLDIDASTKLGPVDHESLISGDTDDVSPDFYLQELISLSRDRARKTIIPLPAILQSISINDTPSYTAERDSFSIDLHVSGKRESAIHIQRIQVQIRRLDSQSSKEIWLESEGAFEIGNGTSNLAVSSNVSLHMHACP